MKKTVYDIRHPFFLPLWRRVVVCGFTVGWALYELLTGSPFWAILFGAAGFYCVWVYFITFDPAKFNDKDDDK